MKQTERTLVLLKPCTIKRNLIGEIISIFEKKGLRVVGLKMMQLTDEVLSEHYSHLAEKPFFQRVKDSMMATPVVAMCGCYCRRACFGRTYQRTYQLCAGNYPRHVLHELSGEHRSCQRLARDSSRRAEEVLQGRGDL